MPAGLGRFAYPLSIVVVVSTTWCLAWARSLTDESARGYWPAKDPELMRRVLMAPAAAGGGMAPAEASAPLDERSAEVSLRSLDG